MMMMQLGHWNDSKYYDWKFKQAYSYKVGYLDLEGFDEAEIIASFSWGMGWVCQQLTA